MPNYPAVPTAYGATLGHRVLGADGGSLRSTGRPLNPTQLPHSSRGRCLMVKASNHRRRHGLQYTDSQGKLTGLYGALVKRMSRKMFGEVPEPVGAT